MRRILSLDELTGECGYFTEETDINNGWGVIIQTKKSLKCYIKMEVDIPIEDVQKSKIHSNKVNVTHHHKEILNLMKRNMNKIRMCNAGKGKVQLKHAV